MTNLEYYKDEIKIVRSSNDERRHTVYPGVMDLADFLDTRLWWLSSTD